MVGAAEAAQGVLRAMLKSGCLLACWSPLQLLALGAPIWCGLAEDWNRVTSKGSAWRRVHGGGLLVERRLLFFASASVDCESIGIGKREAQCVVQLWV